jgi:O-antigen/teichoic acid export membrane protein
MRWSAIQLACFHFIKLFRGAIIPRLLLPASYGLSNSALLPLNFVRYTDLGILEQLAKRLPYKLGQEGREAFLEEAGRGASWILLTSLLSAAMLFGASYFVTGAHAGFYRYSMRLLAAIAFVQKSRLLLNVILGAQEEFRSSNLGQIFTDIANLVSSVFFIIWLGPIGVLWGFLLAEITGGIYNLSKAGFPRLRFSPYEMIRMVREGILLLLVAVVEATMMSVDQLFLVRFFPVTQYGLYSLGLFMTSALLSVSAIFMVTHPRILSLAGEGQEEEARRIVCSNLTLYGVVLAAGIGFLIPMMTLVIRFYLPHYLPGVSIYMLLAGLAIFRGPVILLRPFFLARNQERRLIACQVAGLTAIVALDSLIVALNGSLTQVALASACGYCITSLLLIVDFEKSFAEAAVKRFKRYGLFLASAVGCGVLYGFYASYVQVGSGWHYVTEALEATALYGAAMLVLTYAVRSELLAGFHYIRLSGVASPGTLPGDSLEDSESLIPSTTLLS